MKKKQVLEIKIEKRKSKSTEAHINQKKEGKHWRWKCEFYFCFFSNLDKTKSKATEI